MDNPLPERQVQAFHSAISVGRKDLVEKVLAKDPRFVNARMVTDGKLGSCPIHTACESDHFFDMTEILVRYGAKITDMTNGVSVLHSAALAGKAGNIKALCENFGAKALIESEDKDGITPLGYAAAQNQCDCIQELLNQGANRDHRNKQGLSVEQLAGCLVPDQPNITTLLLLNTHARGDRVDPHLRSAQTTAPHATQWRSAPPPPPTNPNQQSTTPTPQLLKKPPS